MWLIDAHSTLQLSPAGAVVKAENTDPGAYKKFLSKFSWKNEESIFLYRISLIVPTHSFHTFTFKV